MVCAATIHVPHRAGCRTRLKKEAPHTSSADHAASQLPLQLRPMLAIAQHIKVRHTLPCRACVWLVSCTFQCVAWRYMHPWTGTRSRSVLNPKYIYNIGHSKGALQMRLVATLAQPAGFLTTQPRTAVGASPHLQHASYLPAEGTTKERTRAPATAAALTHVCHRPHAAQGIHYALLR